MLFYVKSYFDSFQRPRRNRRICLSGIFQRQEHDAFESLCEIMFEVADSFDSSRQGQSFGAEKCRDRDSQPFAEECYSVLRLQRDHCSSLRLKIQARDPICARSQQLAASRFEPNRSQPHCQKPTQPPDADRTSPCLRRFSRKDFLLCLIPV
jgi:hypothetical protein